MALLGLDIGTTGCKSTILREDGACLAKSYREYHAQRGDEKHTLCGREIWDSVREVIARSAAQAGEPVRAIGISSFGEAFVPVDRDGNPLYEIMLNTDPRGAEECRALAALAGEDAVSEIAGAAPHPMYSLPKMMWLKRNEPEIFSNTYKLLLMEDYILFRLTGGCFIDYSLAARTMTFDIRRMRWSGTLLNAAGIPESMLSEPVAPGTPCGRLRPGIAAELLLPPDTVAVTGGHDQVCAAVGVGALSEGVCVDGTGTVECITPVFKGPLTGAVMKESGYACVPHAVDGLYVTYAFSFTGGALLKWFRDAFCAEQAAEMERAGKNFYAHMDSRAGGPPGGLLLLPHFAGAATPYMDPAARGALIGLHLGTTADDLYRGILEGVAYEMRVNAERLEKAGIPVRELRATGGGAYSDVWLQIKADILGKRLTAYENCEAGTVGAVALAGSALGVYAGLPEAAGALARAGRSYEPQAERRAEYDLLFKKYAAMYGAVKSVLNA